MIDEHEKLPTVKNYIEHPDKLDAKYPKMSIKGELSNKGTGLQTVLENMFKCNFIREINLLTEDADDNEKEFTSRDENLSNQSSHQLGLYFHHRIICPTLNILRIAV